ncbi:MAG: M48 family metallopeptidase [Armatimonadota bacterium]
MSTERIAQLRERVAELVQAQDWAQAHVVFEEWASHCPDDPQVLYNWALVLRKIGRLEKAESVLRRADELKPDHPLISKALAEITAQQTAPQDTITQIVPGHVTRCQQCGQALTGQMALCPVCDAQNAPPAASDTDAIAAVPRQQPVTEQAPIAPSPAASLSASAVMTSAPPSAARAARAAAPIREVTETKAAPGARVTCGQCGRSLPAQARFCTGCSAPITGVTPTAATTSARVPTPAPLFAAARVPAPAPAPMVSPTAQMTINRLRDPNENTALIVLLLLAAPALIGLTILLLLTFGFGTVIALVVVLMGLLTQLMGLASVKVNGIRVSPEQLPELYNIAVQCAQRLGVPVPEVYVYRQSNAWNALAMKAAKKKVIVVEPELVDAILLKGDYQQLAFIIGRELGHQVAGHTAWWQGLLRLGAWIPPVMLWYNRRCILTADRVGLYCAGGLRTSLLALTNLTAGAHLAERVNIAAMLGQWEEHKNELLVHYQALNSAYPSLLWRCADLASAAYTLGVPD